jgi:hypothetical protein
VGWGGMDWINLTQDWDSRQALVNSVMKKVQPTDGNCLTGCGPVSFSGKTLLRGISRWPITIHLCRHNLQLVTKQHPGENNPLIQLAIDTTKTSHEQKINEPVVQ